MRTAVLLAVTLLALVCAAKAAPASRLFLTRDENVQNGARSVQRRELASATDSETLSKRAEAEQRGQPRLFHPTSTRELHTFSGGNKNGHNHGGHYGSNWQWGSELDR